MRALFFLFGGDNNADGVENDSGQQQITDTFQRSEGMIEGTELYAHFQFEVGDDIIGSAFEAFCHGVSHEDFTEQGSRMRDGEELNHILYRLVGAADGQINTGDKADEGTDNGAGGSKSILCMEKGYYQIHHGGTGQDGQEHYAERLQELQTGEQSVALTSKVYFNHGESKQGHDTADTERTDC